MFRLLLRSKVIRELFGCKTIYNQHVLKNIFPLACNNLSLYLDINNLHKDIFIHTLKIKILHQN